MCGDMHHGTCVDVRGPLCGVTSLLLWIGGTQFSHLSLLSHLTGLECAMLSRMILNYSSSSFHFQKAGIIGMCHHTWLYAVLRLKSKVLCVSGKHSTNGATYPSSIFLKYILIINYFFST